MRENSGRGMDTEIKTHTYSVIDKSPAPMLLVDDDYTIAYCNNPMSQAVNADPEEIIGKSALDLVPESEQSESKRRINKVIENREPVEEREYTFLTLDNKKRVASGSVLPAGTNQAHIILQDISNKLSYKERIEELHTAAVDIMSSTERQEIYDKIVDTMASVLELEQCVVAYIDENGTSRHGASTLPESGYHNADIYDEEESGLGGLAYRNDENIIVDNLQEDERANPQADYRSAMFIPEHEMVIQAVSFKEGLYTETDAKLVSILAQHAKQALLRLEREKELETQRTQVERLHSVGVELTGCDSQQRATELMIEAAEDILGIDYCLVDVVADGKFRTVAKSSGLDSEAYHEPELDSEEAGLAGKAYRQGESILVDDAQEHPDANPQDEYQSTLTVPIGEYGVFQALAYEEVGFTETDLELTELVAGHVERALRQSKHEKELRQQRNEIELLQSVFSRVFRHNIKNELQVIIGNGEMIKSTSESESISHGAEILLEATERLVESTEKAREVETVVREQREVQTGSLRRIVSTAVAGYKREYTDSTIIDDVDEVDISAIIGVEKAISNAVENSFRHNQEPVTVELWSTVGEDSVTLYIEDDGSGIPESELEVLSNEGESALKHGSGVGLWLMKWSVEKSGGRLNLGNTDSGAQIRMELPLAE